MTHAIYGRYRWSYLLSLALGLILPAARVVGVETDAPPPKSSLAAENPSDAVARLKPGQWYEVPNSTLEAVAASEKKFPWLSGGIGGITACWAGGALDSQRDRLYLGPGGGHAGYNGNEIYSFDLHDLKWHRLNDPDPVIKGTEYTDLNKAPFAMHTYDGVEYLPPPCDRYLVVGGWATPRTYALDPDKPQRWEIYPDHGTGRTGDLCGYDPISDRLFLSTPTTAGKLSQYDPLEHRWTLRTITSPEPSYYETADVDYKRRLLVSCGKGKVKVWHLTAPPEKIAAEEITTTGDSEILNRSSPGFCYVPQLDKFVAWGEGASVYTLDIDAKKWTRHPPAADNHVTPGPPDQWGTFGRFRYVASMNLFVLYNATKQNVFIYRMTGERPNPITAVKATATKASIESDLATAAIRVEAQYADGSSKDVTREAFYFSLDPKLAEVELHGEGRVRGLTAGKARIRAAYTDPAYKRGYGDEVSVEVNDILGAATLDSIATSFRRLTIVAGDRYPLAATAAYSRGSDHFSRDCTARVQWHSAAAERVAVEGGMIRAIRSGEPVEVQATLDGKTTTTEVTVVDKPVIERICFQVQDTSPRSGWKAESGQRYSDARGYGWLNIEGIATRDDRNSAKALLLKRFNTVDEKPFKLKLPRGQYTVRISMGDADYGKPPFEGWTAFGKEKLIYYQGHANNSATKIVTVGDEGLVLTVNGPINYLVVAPVGIDLAKYAEDGP